LADPYRGQEVDCPRRHPKKIGKGRRERRRKDERKREETKNRGFNLSGYIKERRESRRKG